jgi:hypothetical protein
MKLVTLVLTFDCPNSHKITIQLPHEQSSGAMRELETTEFSLHCPVCKWDGTMKGDKRTSLSTPKD